MATTLNRVTIGNDFDLKIKVGMVQYSPNEVIWDYMDLTTCSDIVFNITCNRHDIDINLQYTIDENDPSIIVGNVKAEYLHENSIYNFSITGKDKNGYRWTYISPKQQSFITTDVSQDSANAYTELAFTAGMIMPMATPGKDGYTPYIGDNNHWYINGQDTGVSAVADVDLTDYATKEYVDDAVENIDLPDIDTSDLVRKEDISYGNCLDWEGWNLPALDTGVLLNDNLRFEIDLQKRDNGNAHLDSSMIITAGPEIDDEHHITRLIQIGSELDKFTVHYGYIVTNLPPHDFDRHIISVNLHDGIYCDGQYCVGTGTQNSLTESILNQGYQIPNILLHYGLTNNIAIYNIKIYDGDTLLRDYEPVTTENEDGYYDKVNDTYLLKDNLEYKQYYKYLKDITDVKNELNSRIDNIDISDIDTSELVRNEDISNGSYLDWEGENLPALDTGIYLDDNLRFEIDLQRIDKPNHYLEHAMVITGGRYTDEYGHISALFQIGSHLGEGFAVLYGYDVRDIFNDDDFDRHLISINLHDGVYCDGQYVEGSGTEDSLTEKILNDGYQIPMISLNYGYTNNLMVYNIKIYNGDTLLRDYVPVTNKYVPGTTDNRNGYYDKVSGSYMLKDNLECKQYYKYLEDIENVKNELNSNLVKKDDILYGNYVDGDYADLDTGVVLSDTLRFVVDYQKYGLATSFLDNRPLISGFSNDIMYFAFGSQDNEAMRVYYVDTFDYYVPNTGTDFNRHTIEWSLRGGLYFDNEHLAEGTQSSIVDRITNDGNTIPNIYFHRNETNHIALYNVKIYDGDTLLRDYEPVTTENGNGYHDKVNDTYLLSNNLNYYDYYRFPEIKQYNKALNDINNRINNIDLWNPVNEIYSYYDCTEAIDKILNNDTITIGVDIQSLWECAFNHDLRKAIPVYKNSPVSWYVDRDENNQTLKTYYRFWNRGDGLYYNVTVQWYYSYDGGEILWGNIVSTSYSTTEYTTKGYVDNAIQNIPVGSTPGGNTPSIETMTQAQYDTLIADGLENPNTLYIIL